MSMTNEQACELDLRDARAKIEQLQQNFDLLCAAIADEALSRVSLRCIARNIQNPLKPTPEAIEWAKKIIRNRGSLAVEQELNDAKK